MNSSKQPALPPSGKTHHPAYLFYLYFMIALGLAIVAWALLRVPFSGSGYQWVILAALTIPTSYFSIRIPSTNSKIALGDTLFFGNVILFGIPAGTITAAVEALFNSVRARNRSRRFLYVMFNVAAMALSAHLSGTLFFAMLGHEPLFQPPPPSAVRIIIPLGILALSHYLLNSGFVAIIVALERRKNIYLVWKESFLWTSGTYFAGAAAAGVIALNVGPSIIEIVGLAFLVLMAVYLSYKTYLGKVEEVRSLAYYDSLTTLPNRVLFKEHLEQALRTAERDDEMLGVMFLDLDNFKRINDSYGHSVGDLLIKCVAERLRLCLRTKTRDSSDRLTEPDIVVGRFGGDEFNLLMRQLRSLQDAARVAQRILEAFSTSFVLDGQEVSVTASIGISVYPFDGKDSETLLKNADAAMFHAKSAGKSAYHCYSQFMNATASKRLSLENDLRKALERGEFSLHYQPKIDTQTTRLTGAEALIRWQHPDRGLLLASEFISLAEETGMVKPIGEWVLHTACAQVSEWQRSGLEAIPVSVNLSSIQFRQKNLSRMISKILSETSLHPSYLELEITEGTIMENETAADISLMELRDLGVKVSIDDFGTGYSSLSRLKSFTLDTLKIDRSFIMDLPRNARDRAITSAIIAMAHSLDLKVVAEGVENERQLEYLRKLGCDQVQGYIFSKPLPAGEFADLIKDEHAVQELLRADKLPHSGLQIGSRLLATSRHLAERKKFARLRIVANK